jgi:hypothetical protein
VNGNGFGDLNNTKFDGPFIFDSKLYVVTNNSVTGTEIWRTSDGSNWTQANIDGFGDSNNVESLWSTAQVSFKDNLYIGTTNSGNGGEVWQMAFKKLFLPFSIR